MVEQQQCYNNIYKFRHASGVFSLSIFVVRFEGHMSCRGRGQTNKDMMYLQSPSLHRVTNNELRGLDVCD